MAFFTKSKALPVHVKREMIFTVDSITWNFEVYNSGSGKLPFQHVMHPLMKLTEIAEVHVPGFQTAYNKSSDTNLALKSPDDVQAYLMKQPKGTANMLFLKMIEEGKLSWKYKNGTLVNVTFPKEYFPAIGIWWNNIGYPNEIGIERDECAFEPIPGFSSNLSKVFSDGNALTVLPKARFRWQITWKLSKE